MSDSITQTTHGPIPGPVVAQFFGFFNGVSLEHYQKIIDTAPFDKCNLLILGFVHAVQDPGLYWVPAFTEGRDGNKPPGFGGTDESRVRQVVQAARAKNHHGIKILISLGWGNNDAGWAAETPTQFARVAAGIVKKYDLDGFDIDFESTTVEPAKMLTLAQELRRYLIEINFEREMILTITPAQTGGLDQSVLKEFTYVLPQSYGGGDFQSMVADYADILGSYDRIVPGLDSEGDVGQTDDPKPRVALMRQKNAAGIFAWRLDNDSLNNTGYPTFATGIEMWRLVKNAEPE